MSTLPAPAAAVQSGLRCTCGDCALCDDDHAEGLGIETEVRAAVAPVSPDPADDPDSAPCGRCRGEGWDDYPVSGPCCECGGIGSVYDPGWRERLTAEWAAEFRGGDAPAAMTRHELDAELYRIGHEAGRAGEPCNGLTSPPQWWAGFCAGAAERAESTPAEDWTEDDYPWTIGPGAADDRWNAEQTPDAQGLTDREAERLSIDPWTVSALDWMLESMHPESEEYL